MKRLFLLVIPLFLFLFTLTLPVHAGNPLDEVRARVPQNSLKFGIGTAQETDCAEEDTRDYIDNPARGENSVIVAMLSTLVAPPTDACGNPLFSGLLPTGGKYLAMTFQNQPSSQEYVADIMNNIGIPQINSAYAQSTSGTGYNVLSPFLPIWKVFRNLAYSLYIIMFIVIGVMIMLRTKVNAQTIITIQSALPNLLITLILITFSYAIVGFMIDLMYFLIYFIVYLADSAGLIQTPTATLARLLDHSAWSVIFEGRNSIISGIAAAIDNVLSGLGNGALGLAGKVVGFTHLSYLIVAVWLAIAMIKLMWILIKSYVMLLVQLITAPIQILMNAMPGSKAFSDWLKKTASYLLPFPIVAGMVILSAVLIGDPTQTYIFKDKGSFGGSANPLSVNTTALPKDRVWMPPFTLTDTNLGANDLMALIGLFIFAMIPQAAKMAQDWMQVKESPYSSEIAAGLGGAWQFGGWPIRSAIGAYERQAQYRQQAKIFGGAGFTRPGEGIAPSAPVGSKEPVSKS